jgi:hypothetical protein
MKQKLANYLTALLCFSLLFASCKKDDKKTPDAPTEVQISTHSDDESLVSEEIDATSSDANSILESNASLSGDASVADEIICDATVTYNVESDPMTITINFNGNNCGVKRTRTGVMVLSMAKGTHWKDAGASITVNFQDLKITRKSDKKSITLNGTHVYTNVSGGLLYQTASLGSIVHTVASSDLSIKFDDGTARNWNVARKKEFTYENGLVITVTGTHTEGDDTQVAEWGSNRFGNTFITSITAPVVVKQDCDFRVTAGAIQHKTDVFTATATFGLDATGNSTTCPGAGNYYYKLGWKNNNNANTFTIILPY